MSSKSIGLHECIQFIDRINREQCDTKVTLNNEIEIVTHKGELARKSHLIAQNTSNRICCFENGLKYIQHVKSQHTWKLPWIIILFSVAQVVVYSVGCNDSAARLMFKPQKKYDLWRFFTYQLVHINSIHLVLNVTLQILIAFPLESVEGHFRVLVVYIGGVFFGALASLIFDSKQAIIGSSAGVYSLLFSHMSQCILNWESISHRTFRLVAVLTLLAGDILYSTLTSVNDEPKISYAAHIGGSVAGLLTGLLIFKRK